MTLLHDPLISDQAGRLFSLPGLFATLSRGEVSDLPALRPHQRAAWHMTCVQIAALACWQAGQGGLAKDEDGWRDMLLGLTQGEEAPWALIPQEGEPGFLQPADPGALKWTQVATPDALDLLITSRNHDLKREIAAEAEAQDWLFALVSLQVSEGYGGRGNHGIARMNGGSSSRAMVARVPMGAGLRIDPSAWFRRDVTALLRARAEGRHQHIGTQGGPALLWTLPWPEGRKLSIGALDPWFVEVCRRVRLYRDAAGAIRAMRATSTAGRIEAKAQKGAVGDPWAPVHKGEGKAFTLSSGDFDYRTIDKLYFGTDWERPLLSTAQPDDADGPVLLLFEALARGNSKTEGFRSRVVVMPRALNGREVDAGVFSKEQIADIAEGAKALNTALALVVAGGADPSKEDRVLVRSSGERMQARLDAVFFDYLGARLEGAPREAFQAEVRAQARATFEAEWQGYAVDALFRHRAEARARRTLDIMLARLRTEEMEDDA